MQRMTRRMAKIMAIIGLLLAVSPLVDDPALASPVPVTSDVSTHSGRIAGADLGHGRGHFLAVPGCGPHVAGRAVPRAP